MKRLQNTKGWAMVDTMVAIVVNLIIFGGITVLWTKSNDQTKYAGAAQQLRMFQPALNSYMRDNYVAITAATTAAQSYELLPNLLVPKYLQALPKGEVDAVYGQNVYGQRFRIFALQPTPGNLQVLLITEGGDGAATTTANFQNIGVSAIAGMVGASGGYVVGSAKTLQGTTATTLSGSFGTWKIDLATTDITTKMVVGPGHLAMNLSYANGQLVTDYLSRYATGDPEVNKMHTDLNMNSNKLNSVGDITVDTNADGTPADVNVTLGNFNALLGGVNTKTADISENLTVGGDAVVTGAVDSNSMSTVFDLSAGRNLFSTNTYTSNQTNTTVLTLGIAINNGDCSMYGAGTFASDVSGKMMSCYNGKWTSSGLISGMPITHYTNLAGDNLTGSTYYYYYPGSGTLVSMSIYAYTWHHTQVNGTWFDASGGTLASTVLHNDMDENGINTGAGALVTVQAPPGAVGIAIDCVDECAGSTQLVSFTDF